MATDRYMLGLQAALGGAAAVRGELRWHTPGELAGELVTRAVADACAARAAGIGPTSLVRALADLTGATRPAPVGRPRGPYRPRLALTVTEAVVALRADGASFNIIAEKTGVPASTASAVIARYEARTGVTVTPERTLGRDGKLRRVRHASAPGGMTT